MFSLTSEEQHQVVTACAGVFAANRAKHSAVYKEDETSFGMAAAKLNAEIARLFAVVVAIEGKESASGEETEPPF